MIRNNTVYSESGKKLSRRYKTKAEAAHRLGEIEYFKHHPKGGMGRRASRYSS